MLSAVSDVTDDDRILLPIVLYTRMQRHPHCFEVAPSNRYSEEMSHPSVCGTEIFALPVQCGSQWCQVFVLCRCRGPSPETLSSLVQAEGLSSSRCPSTGAQLETSEELISSEIRSKMGLGFHIYCIPTGFPFQTWFVETIEGHIRCIS